MKPEDRLKKIIKTENELRTVFEHSLQVMLNKNRERSDCWRSVGLIGSFLEIRTMYVRLRALVWEIEPPSTVSIEYHHWKLEVKNALEDLRNYTMLAELSLEDDNIRGVGDDQ